MKKIAVNLGKRSYPIFVGAKIENLGRQIKSFGFSSNTFVITNPTVRKLYYSQVEKGLQKAGFQVFSCIIGDGERYKNLETVKKIYHEAIKAKLDRCSLIIALGGGVVGDIAGFAAATYLRGLPFVQVPTTLLAMVDSSVGGKTGVDLKEGKNLVGAFYQPKLVWIDVSTLNTLPQRQLRNGLAEVIKYGIISDKKFFDYLESFLSSHTNNPPVSHFIKGGYTPPLSPFMKGGIKGDLKFADFEKIITHCCQFKANVVEQDEFEEKGVREILNFGHTFGHAIETLTGYKKYLHGEAIAIGMSMAGKLAEKIGIFHETDRIETILQLAGLPVSFKEKYSRDKFISVMQKDKKAREGKFRFVLPVRIGKVAVRSDIKNKLVKEILLQ